MGRKKKKTMTMTTTESLVEQCLRKARLDLQEKVEALVKEVPAVISVDETAPETPAATMTLVVPSSAVAAAAAAPTSAAVGQGQVDDEDCNKDDDDGYDPDDLAAAFFAKQAQKQQRLNELPMKDWAVCVVNYGQKTKRRSNEKEDQKTRNADSNDDADNRSIARTKTIDRTMDAKTTDTESQLSEEEVENLANQLFFEFKKIIASS